VSDRETLPCGCVMEVVLGTFVFTACAKGRACPNVQYVLAETERQGKPTAVLE